MRAEIVNVTEIEAMNIALTETDVFSGCMEKYSCNQGREG